MQFKKIEKEWFEVSCFKTLDPIGRERVGVDYKPFDQDYAHKRAYKYFLYDEIFNFLYKAPFLYSQVLDFVLKIHDEFGLLTPIPDDLIFAQDFAPVPIVRDVLYTLQRRKILLKKEGENGAHLYLINKYVIIHNIIDQMMYRHPSITRNKPLGYKDGTHRP